MPFQQKTRQYVIISDGGKEDVYSEDDLLACLQQYTSMTEATTMLVKRTVIDKNVTGLLPSGPSIPQSVIQQLEES
jgi:hypothetical protein